MIRYRESFYLKLILFSLLLCLKCFVCEDNYKIKNVPEDLVSDLYLKYMEAISDDTILSSRRLLKNNKQYDIHIKRLKDVNGFKIHNLMIKENLRTDLEPLIYINNPVESKIPKAYLSLEEFKNLLTNRVMKQRNELTTKYKKTLLKAKPKTADLKANTNDTKLNNKVKSIIIDTRNVNLTTGIESSLDTTIFTSSVTKLGIFTKEPIMTKLQTGSTTNLNHKYEEESIRNIEKRLIEKNLDDNKFSDKVMATTVRLDIANKTTYKNEDKTTLDIEKELIQTTLSNVTEKLLETMVKDNENIQELIKEVNNNEQKVLTTTDIETLQEENISKTQLITVKDKPRRKTTIKLSLVSKISEESLKQEKRSTLGRPLVFMGNRKR